MRIFFYGAGFFEKRLLKKVFRFAADYLEQPVDIRLTLTFLDENGMRKLNSETRGADKPTDVLSFQFLAYLKAGEKVQMDRPEDVDVTDGCVDLGEIYLCRSVARRQARQFGHSYRREISFLALHGLLHLLGYDHINEEDEREMFAAQEKILTALDIGRS